MSARDRTYQAAVEGLGALSERSTDYGAALIAARRFARRADRRGLGFRPVVLTYAGAHLVGSHEIAP